MFTSKTTNRTFEVSELNKILEMGSGTLEYRMKNRNFPLPIGKSAGTRLWNFDAVATWVYLNDFEKLASIKDAKPFKRYDGYDETMLGAGHMIKGVRPVIRSEVTSDKREPAQFQVWINDKTGIIEAVEMEDRTFVKIKEQDKLKEAVGEFISHSQDNYTDAVHNLLTECYHVITGGFFTEHKSLDILKSLKCHEEEKKVEPEVSLEKAFNEDKESLQTPVPTLDDFAIYPAMMNGETLVLHGSLHSSNLDTYLDQLHNVDYDFPIIPDREGMMTKMHVYLTPVEVAGKMMYISNLAEDISKRLEDEAVLLLMSDPVGGSEQETPSIHHIQYIATHYGVVDLDRFMAEGDRICYDDALKQVFIENTVGGFGGARVDVRTTIDIAKECLRFCQTSPIIGQRGLLFLTFNHIVDWAIEDLQAQAREEQEAQEEVQQKPVVEPVYVTVDKLAKIPSMYGLAITQGGYLINVETKEVIPPQTFNQGMFYAVEGLYGLHNDVVYLEYTLVQQQLHVISPEDFLAANERMGRSEKVGFNSLFDSDVNIQSNSQTIGGYWMKSTSLPPKLMQQMQTRQAQEQRMSQMEDNSRDQRIFGFKPGRATSGW